MKYSYETRAVIATYCRDLTTCMLYPWRIIRSNKAVSEEDLVKVLRGKCCFDAAFARRRLKKNTVVGGFLQ